MGGRLAVEYADNPALHGNPDHEIMLEALIKTYQDSAKEVKQLEVDVEACKTEVFRSLETLSIATGSFEFFSQLSEERANSLNAIYDSRSKQQKSNTHPINESDLKELMRSIVTTNIDTEQGQEEFKARMNQMLPVLEEYGRIMSETEKDIFDIEHEFYTNVRNETSERISELFEEGFFGWFF